jgi:hypothetical protein
MPQFGDSGDKIGQAVAVARYILQEGSFRVSGPAMPIKSLSIIKEEGGADFPMTALNPPVINRRL